MNATRFAHAALVLFMSVGLGAAACSADPNHGNGGSGGGGNGGNPGTGAGAGQGASKPLPTSICLWHNCSQDIECEACADGKTTCLVSEHRCVACNAANPGGCPAGQTCSSWGNCAAETATCPTDNGVPTIACDENKDCAACDPMHQVCDPNAHKCVACTKNDLTQCQSTDTCNGGDCVPKCPATCTSDADCTTCGAPGHEAHTCMNHQCSECSPRVGCDGTLSCGEHGTCEKVCGIEGKSRGACEIDADCSACDKGATRCHTPIGGGLGACGPAAAGCSDLGNGVAVLPSPFDKVTNLCSNDADCAGVGATVNVGKLLRDWTGWDAIHDANIDYPMHACAALQLMGKSCGVCVPCKVDSDCQDLHIDEFATDAFGPLGTIGSVFLLDQLFGVNDHIVHMYCETVAGEYGVCAPCPGLLQDCHTGQPPADPGSTAHDECTVGDPLGAANACAVAVCMADAYCCASQWDQFCVDEVGSHCDHACERCTEPANGGHDKCGSGQVLDPGCSPCVWAICGALPHCCNGSSETTTWDQDCIDAVPAYCERGYLCQGQCNAPATCAPQGCLASYTCGPCVADYDCGVGKHCNTTSGTCQ